MVSLWMTRRQRVQLSETLEVSHREPEPEKVETALTLSEPPKADAARYDSLRADHAAQEDHHV